MAKKKRKHKTLSEKHVKQNGLWESSGRDEPIWVVIHICVVITLGISLYSYLYLRLAKPLYFSYYLLCFSSTTSEIRRVEQVLPGSGMGGANNVHTCK
jgi:hypothetical protein